MNQRFIKLAVLYAVIAISIGISMAATHDFSQKAVHAHANLVGWVSLGLMGVVYRLWPVLEGSKLATAHFWLHNLGLPVMLVGIWLIHGGQPETGEPFAGIGSTLVGLGFLSFALNVWRNLRATD